MKFLTQLGGILLKATQIAVGFAPLIAAAAPGAGPVAAVVTSELTQLSNIIVSVEVMGQVLGLPGPDKLKTAVPLVAQVILQSSMFVGRKIALPDLFKAGCEKIASGFADVLNSLKDDVKTVDKAA